MSRNIITIVTYFNSAPLINGFILFAFGICCCITSWWLSQEALWSYTIENAFARGRHAKDFSKFTIHLFLGKFFKSVELSNLVDTFSFRKKCSSDQLMIEFDRLFGRATTVLRYLPSAMVTLGLIGTFLGLSKTVSELAIMMLNMSLEADVSASMENMMSGLAQSIQGMGVAFHTSLFGVTSSLGAGLMLLLYQKGGAFFERRIWNLADSAGMIVDDRTEVLADALLEASEAVYQSATILNRSMDETRDTFKQTRQAHLSLLREQTECAEEISRSMSLQLDKVTGTVEKGVTNLFAACKTIENSFNQAFSRSLDRTEKSFSITLEKITEQTLSVMESQEKGNMILSEGINNVILSVKESRHVIEQAFSQISNEIGRVSERLDHAAQFNHDMIEQITVSVALAKNDVIQAVDRGNNHIAGSLDKMSTHIGYIKTELSNCVSIFDEHLTGISSRMAEDAEHVSKRDEVLLQWQQVMFEATTEILEVVSSVKDSVLSFEQTSSHLLTVHQNRLDQIIDISAGIGSDLDKLAVLGSEKWGAFDAEFHSANNALHILIKQAEMAEKNQGISLARQLAAFKDLQQLLNDVRGFMEVSVEKICNTHANDEKKMMFTKKGRKLRLTEKITPIKRDRTGNTVFGIFRSMIKKIRPKN